MQILTHPHPFLHRHCRADFILNMDDIQQMFFLMREKSGLGLSAPQVGIDARFFVTEWNEVFVNPRITGLFDLCHTVEGCLSLPGIKVRVPRWNQILMPGGRIYEGLRAFVIQHEIDHLNGTLITDFQPMWPYCNEQ